MKAMSFFQISMIYIMSWWLILFMVLPFGVRMEEKPGKGHAASAPTHPRLKKKFLITTLLAIIPVLGFWGVSAAWAESGIYHAGAGDAASGADMYHARSNDCPPPVDYHAPEDINAKDTVTQNPVDPKQFERTDLYLNLPGDQYTDPPLDDPYQGSSLNVGRVSTNTTTGEVTLNGQKIGGSAENSHCK